MSTITFNYVRISSTSEHFLMKNAQALQKSEPIPALEDRSAETKKPSPLLFFHAEY